MPLRLRITGEGLRITGRPDPGGGRSPAPPPPPDPDVLLATEAGEPVATETGESIAVEQPTNAQ